MKLIEYQLMTEVNYGTDQTPNIIKILSDKRIQCPDDVFESNLAIAQAEAYNGEYTVEDVPDEVTEPTQLDQIEAQVTYTAMMTDTLLEV